jgi:hypothetical protein
MVLNTFLLFPFFLSVLFYSVLFYFIFLLNLTQEMRMRMRMIHEFLATFFL